MQKKIDCKTIQIYDLYYSPMEQEVDTPILSDSEIDELSDSSYELSNHFFDDIMSLLLSSREPKEPFIDTLTDDEIIDMTSTVYELTDEYIHEHILDMLDPQFHNRMIDYITVNLFELWSDAELCSHGEDDDDPEDDYADVREFISNIIDDYFIMSQNWDSRVPIRSDSISSTCINNKDMNHKILNIRAIPQPSQRTPEWYEFRHGLITASNLYKVFGSDALRNSLIYEKCLPLKEDRDCIGSTHVNTMSPMHWGQKYEPVSVMLYEKLYKSKVEEFGCIQHPQYSYIGASPDGIITDSSSERYGRMLEIKNIVNRDITVPSKAYWVQMQIQMETCDLDKCDFIETRFKEYDDEDTFYTEDNNKHRGVILYFIERVSIGGCSKNDDNESGYPLAQQYSGEPKYVYMPLDIELTKDSIDEWIETTRSKMRRSWSLYTTIYWYLDEISCILVERNRLWFKRAQPQIEETWNTILKERETGYEHRAAKKKIVKLEVVKGEDGSDSKQIKNLPVMGGVCLVKLE